MNKEIERLRDDIELEGYVPDTPEFERIFIARKVKRCQMLQNVTECRECRAHQDCELVRQHMINVKYGGK